MNEHPALLFDAIIVQLREIDQRCTDPGLTPYMLAATALAQQGFNVTAGKTGSITLHGQSVNSS